MPALLILCAAVPLKVNVPAEVGANLSVSPAATDTFPFKSNPPVVNPKLIDAISLQLQTESRFIFKNIITPEDKFALTICNPPFHSSDAEATKSTIRKINNLNPNKIRTTIPVLNFGGQNAELWCDGGELGFITEMIFESSKYPLQCLWFTTLVSKKENLASLYKTLNKVQPADVKTIEMAQGQKNSRILAWTFMSVAQQKVWNFKS